MRFQVAWEGMVVALNPAAAEPSNVEEHLDRVMQELLEIDAQDISISLVGSEGLVEMSVTVEAESVEDAVANGSAVLRSAIHAAGGFTPGWSIDWTKVQASKADLVQA